MSLTRVNWPAYAGSLYRGRTSAPQRRTDQRFKLQVPASHRQEIAKQHARRTNHVEVPCRRTDSFVTAPARIQCRTEALVSGARKVIVPSPTTSGRTVLGTGMSHRRCRLARRLGPGDFPSHRQWTWYPRRRTGHFTTSVSDRLRCASQRRNVAPPRSCSHRLAYSCAVLIVAPRRTTSIPSHRPEIHNRRRFVAPSRSFVAPSGSSKCRCRDMKTVARNGVEASRTVWRFKMSVSAGPPAGLSQERRTVWRFKMSVSVGGSRYKEYREHMVAPSGDSKCRCRGGLVKREYPDAYSAFRERLGRQAFPPVIALRFAVAQMLAISCPRAASGIRPSPRCSQMKCCTRCIASRFYSAARAKGICRRSFFRRPCI